MISLYLEAYSKPSSTYLLGTKYTTQEVVRLLAKSRIILLHNKIQVAFHAYQTSVGIEYATRTHLVRIVDGLYILDKLLGNGYKLVEHPPTLATIPVDTQLIIYTLANSRALLYVSKVVHQYSSKVLPNMCTALPQIGEFIEYMFKHVKVSKQHEDNSMAFVVNMPPYLYPIFFHLSKVGTKYSLVILRYHIATSVEDILKHLVAKAPNINSRAIGNKKEITAIIYKYILPNYKLYVAAPIIQTLLESRIQDYTNIVADRGTINTTIANYIEVTYKDYATNSNHLPLQAILGTIDKQYPYGFPSTLKFLTARTVTTLSYYGRNYTTEELLHKYTIPK